MTKADLQRAVKDRVNAKDYKSKAALNRIIQAVFDVIVETVESGESVCITGFGAFRAAQRVGRTVRNPQNPGEMISVPPHRAMSFRASSSLKKRMK